ncbi:hypothetical protein HDU96_006105 [Phlyctochytrium bullatum]|nr:hypothetical protein HDU96_006105 [Phlyctochytrium bullatum]
MFSSRGIPLRSVSSDKLSDDPDDAERIQMEESDSSAMINGEVSMDVDDDYAGESPTKRAAAIAAKRRRKLFMTFDLRSGAGLLPRLMVLMKNPAILMGTLAGMLFLIIYLCLPRTPTSEGEGKKNKYSNLIPLTMDEMHAIDYMLPIPDDIQWIKGTKDGTYVEQEGQKIVLKHIVEKNVTTLVDVGDIRDTKGTAVSFRRFHVSPDRRYLLLEGNDHEKGWRHSYFASYYLHDIAAKMASPLPLSTPKTKGEELGAGKISLAMFGPVGNDVAWVRDNDVYVTIDAKEEVRLTDDGSKNIVNGIADWVYEEEVLSSQQAMWFSPDSKHLAFLKFNDSKVPEIEFQLFYNKESYPKNVRLKYPKAGSPNPITTLYIATPASSTAATKVQAVRFPAASYYPDEDRLIVEVKWLTGTTLFARLMNRVQDSQRLFYVRRAESGEWVAQLVREEEHGDEAWFSLLQPITVIPASPALNRPEPAYLELKEDDKGFTHIAYYGSALQTKPAKFLTTGDHEVTEISSVDLQTGTVYFLSTEEGSTQRHLYSIQLDGEHKRKLTPLPKGVEWGSSVRTLNTTRPRSKEAAGFLGGGAGGTGGAHDGIGDEVGTVGYYAVVFSPESGYAVLTYKGPDVPWQAVVEVNFEGETGASLELVKVVERNEETHKALRARAAPRELYTTVAVPSLQPNVPPVDINVKIQVPIDFDGSGAKKYPMLVKVYGGPGSQFVKQVYEVGFETAVAAMGFVVCTIDPRGTGFRGRPFRTAVSKELGTYESHDVTEAVKAIVEKGFVDEKKVAVWGWSYGGFLTSKIIERDSGVFSVGMAVAPVTDWRYYDSVYTERYMKTPALNPAGYEASAVTRMEGFKNTNFLLMHGTADVHFQNSAMLIYHLTQAHVRKYRSQVFTDSDHSINAGGANQEVYALLLDFMLEKMDVKLPAKGKKRETGGNGLKPRTELVDIGRREITKE